MTNCALRWHTRLLNILFKIKSRKLTDLQVREHKTWKITDSFSSGSEFHRQHKLDGVSDSGLASSTQMGCGTTPGCPEAQPHAVHICGPESPPRPGSGARVRGGRERCTALRGWGHNLNSPQQGRRDWRGMGCRGPGRCIALLRGLPCGPAAASPEKHAASLGAHPERQPACISVSPPVFIPVAIVSLHLPHKLSSGSRSLRTWPRGMGGLWICGPQLIP